MDKLGKLWMTRLAGTALTAVVAVGAVTYFSSRNSTKTDNYKPNNCELRIEKEWKEYKNLCEPFPDKNKLDSFYQKTIKKLNEADCDVKCLEWTCIIEHPDGEYKARERAYCRLPKR
jgi:hypothetical protein